MKRTNNNNDMEEFDFYSSFLVNTFLAKFVFESFISYKRPFIFQNSELFHFNSVLS